MKIQVLFSALLVTNLLLSSVVGVTHRNSIPGDEINNLISLLRSSDDQARQAAKGRILQLGPNSIPALMGSLKEIIYSPGPIFVIGKEEEGKRLLRSMQSAYEAGRDQALKEAARQLSNLDVYERVRWDIIDLLVSLRAEEALPLLVTFIWSGNPEFVSLGQVSLSREAHALTRMGSLAVPKIIEVLEEAGKGANSIQTSSSLPSQPENKALTIQMRRLIQIRSILLLGEIGDPRSLPLLERLLRESKDDLLIPYLRNAVINIEKNH